jgi:YbgC/YbaW family acyl-CoA thioester hydrolase
MREYSLHINLDVRVGDLNYGNHVGHEHYFLYFQEARLAYLKQLGYSESDIEGLGMVVAEASCRYKQELLLGDRIQVHCKITDIKTKAFIFKYAITRGETVCATGATTNLYLDRSLKKVVSLPGAFVRAVHAFETKP